MVERLDDIERRVNQQSVIARINVNRDFGFIKVPGSRDLFFHITSLPPGVAFTQTALVGREVKFEIETDDQGRRRAKRIEFLS